MLRLSPLRLLDFDLRTSTSSIPPVALVAASLLLSACDRIRDVSRRLLDDRPPRERYEASLESAGLASTALVQEWSMAGDRALREAPVVASPHDEEGYLLPAEPTAIAYRVAVRKGQEISFRLDVLGDTSSLLFLDVWQIERDSTTSYRRVADADSGLRSVRFEPRRDGEFVLRAQPELLRGGRFKASLRIAPLLGFPVQGGRENDIGSGFGAPRDAGVRDHHGIDIFARRGTPALAASAATVSRVQTTARGGNVVWLRDSRGYSLYYAHLDRQNVTEGETVDVGDTVGFVGNTGNARTTPPHLHFGVYARGEGPTNPYWFVHRTRGQLPRLEADTGMLGEWARTPRDGTILRAAPDVRADTLRLLPKHTAIRVVAAVGRWFRVRLPDGATGYVGARLAESASRATRAADLSQAHTLLARPAEHPTAADIIANVAAGDSVMVLARFGLHLLVRGPGGASGWIAQ